MVWNVNDLNKTHIRKLVLDLIKKNNPSHIGAFLYPLFLGNPLIKNNLTLEGSFDYDQAIYLYEKCLENSLEMDNPKQKKLYKALVKEYSQLIKNKVKPYSSKRNYIKGIKFGINGGFKYKFQDW